MKKLIDKIGNFQTNMTHLWHREEPEFDAEDLSPPLTLGIPRGNFFFI